MLVIILSAVCALYNLLYIVHSIRAKNYSALAGSVILILAVIALTVILRVFFMA